MVKRQTKRSVFCVGLFLTLCLAFLPGQVQAEALRQSADQMNSLNPENIFQLTQLLPPQKFSRKKIISPRIILGKISISSHSPYRLPHFTHSSLHFFCERE